MAAPAARIWLGGTVGAGREREEEEEEGKE
jgi:hypothetical protein